MTLYLLPNLLSFDREKKELLPSILERIVPTLKGLICESEKAGRQFLSLFREHLEKPVHQIPIAIFNKKTPSKEIDFLLEPLLKNEHWGYVSDCGLPIIADPGHLLVKKAYHYKIEVKTVLGPNALLMALQLSTFACNRFSFYGYLAKESDKRKKEIQKIEKQSKENNEVIVVMEAPFRNEFLFSDLLAHLHDSTKICIAVDLELPSEQIIVKSVKELKDNKIELKKRAALFLINA